MRSTSKMKRMLLHGILSTLVMLCNCETTSLVINVVEVVSNNDVNLACNVSPSTSLTRWTYLSGPSGILLMNYGRCTMSPSKPFLSDENRYEYTCNSTVHQVTILSIQGISNNRILACRDAVQPDGTGSTWMIKIVTDGYQCNCDSTITFSIREIIEGDDVTLICRVSSDVSYVNWNKNIGSNTAAMGGQNGTCTTQGTTFLDRSKYIYTCNNTVYQVTVLNVARSEHNDIYMCTQFGQTEGSGSNWIIKVKAPVTSVTMKPANYLVNVTENTPVESTCTTSTARPTASVYWYRHPNGNNGNEIWITYNITTTTDYNDLSITTSILRFVPTRQDNDTKIFCRANNSVSKSPVKSKMKRLLNVLYESDSPYATQGNEYRVIEDKTGTLSCTVKGGNPSPTLSWSCNKFSPTNQSTKNSNGNVTTTLTWAPPRTHEGTCTCTSQQTGFQEKAVKVSVIVLYPPSKPVFNVKGKRAYGDVRFIEGNSRFIKCITYSKPSPDRYAWTGPRISGSIDIQSLNLSNIRKMDAGEYKCSVHNTMNPSIGGVVAGVNSRTVNVDVLLDGNPLPKIKWNGQNDNLDLLSVTNIERSRTSATCTASNSMKETNRPVVEGNISDGIIFNILVRPTINGCEFYYNSKPTVVNNVTNDKLVIIENASITLKCYADGKLTPTVWWKIPERSSLVTKQSLTVNNLTRHMNGDYVFFANSILEPSFKDKQNFTVNWTVTVEVLYPPVVQPISNVSKLFGEQLNKVCNFTAGSPDTTSIKWTRDTNNADWNTSTLIIESLKKSDTGIYTCTASNIMKQSGDEKSYFGQHNQSFYLDVEYAASITSFSINGFTSQNVTVNESDSIRFLCNAESHPTAEMTLSHENKTSQFVTSNSLEYNIAATKCLDSGIYNCSARNKHNNESAVSNMLKLFVNCYPRVEKVIDGNITSEKNSSVAIVINVVAYPAPTFTWHQLVDGNWTPLPGDSKYVIETANMLSSLTIHNVDMEDFTSYRVIVENDYGQMEKIYTLSPYATPIPPSTPGALIGSIAGSVTGCIVIVTVIIFIIRRYPLFKGNGADRQDIRRSVSDDSDDEDGLVDNPMYESSSNVAPVASTSASTSTDIYSKPVKPNKTNVAGNGDIYSVVNKTNKLGKGGKSKSANEKGKQKEGDVYENFELDNDPRKTYVGKQLPPEPPPTASKLKIVNQDGLIYADLIFKDKPPGEKMVILGDDPTPYDLVDFTKKADPLPESDEEEEK